MVLDGHSHTVMTQGENGEPIQSTGTKFENIGVVVIDNESKGIEDQFPDPDLYRFQALRLQIHRRNSKGQGR